MGETATAETMTVTVGMRVKARPYWSKPVGNVGSTTSVHVPTSIAGTITEAYPYDTTGQFWVMVFDADRCPDSDGGEFGPWQVKQLIYASEMEELCDK